MSELGDNGAFASFLLPINAFLLPEMTRLYEDVVYYHICQARFLLELHMMRRGPFDTYTMDYRGLPLAHVRTLCEKLSPKPTKMSILSNEGEKNSVQVAAKGLLEAVKNLNLVDEASLLKIARKLCTMVDVDENGLPAGFGPFNLEYEVLTKQIGDLKRAIKIQSAILNMFKLRDFYSPNVDQAMLHGCFRRKIYCASRSYYFDRVVHNEGQVLRAVMSLPIIELQSLTMQREVRPILQVLLEGKQRADLLRQVSYLRPSVMRGPVLGQDCNSLRYMQQRNVRLVVEVGRNSCMNEGTISTGMEHEFLPVPSGGRHPPLSSLLAIVDKIEMTLLSNGYVYIAYYSDCAEAVALLSACVVIETSTLSSRDAMFMQGVHYNCENVISRRFYEQLVNFELAAGQGNDFETIEPGSDNFSVAANVSTSSVEEDFTRERTLPAAIEEEEEPEPGNNRQ